MPVRLAVSASKFGRQAQLLDPAPIPETLVGLRSSQRVKQLHLARIRTFIRNLLIERALTGELGFHFVAAAEMARVNLQFLGHEGSTDVITFDHGSTSTRLHGECFICLTDTLQQAEAFRRPWPEELARYLIHGILHLQGFDDLEPSARRTMKREENRLIRWAQGSHDLGLFEKSGLR